MILVAGNNVPIGIENGLLRRAIDKARQHQPGRDGSDAGSTALPRSKNAALVVTVTHPVQVVMRDGVVVMVARAS